ncbi:MAG: hypothetical protein QOK10_954 [Pseudonocardiales bacterium]|nr:hypothetical protein [Pseudonocardiales bacterium]
MTAANPDRTVQLEVFSDVVCPWCYIGETKLKPAIEQFRAEGGRVDVRLRPYLLQPDFTGPSRPLTDYLSERFGSRAAQLTDNVTRAGAEIGLELRMGDAIAASTLLAHQLIEAAYLGGGFATQLAVAEDLFAGHFTRGEDIADPEVLAAAGRRAGLDEATISSALTEPAFAEAVQACLAEARALGITAVPIFVADRAIGVQGAQSPATLLGLLQQAAE